MIRESAFSRTERGWRNADERFFHGVIHAYFDDSKDEKAGRFVSCGGVLGEAFSMTLIEQLWLDATQRLVKPFRSTNCEGQHDQFSSWEKNECTSLMSGLVDILCHPTIHVGAVATVVPVDVFQDVFPGTVAADAYRLALNHIIVIMARLAKKHNERVKLWFKNGPTDADVFKAYSALSKHLPWTWEERTTLAGLSFNDKSLAPLQAADLLAREGMKAALNHGIRPVRIPVRRIWDRAGIIVWGRSCLEKLKDHGGHQSLDEITSLGPECYIEERIQNATSGQFILNTKASQTV